MGRQAVGKKIKRKCKDANKIAIGVAGYDLSSAENVVIPGKTRSVVKTGLEIAILGSTYTRIVDVQDLLLTGPLTLE